MKKLSSLIARRYLRFKGKSANITFMLRVCFLGIAIGTFSLMVTMIIMNGFEKTIHEKMQGITSEIILKAPGNKLDDESIKPFLKNNFGHLVSATASSSVRQVLIDRNKQQNILFLKGVEPNLEPLVSTIASKITHPAHHSSPDLFASLFVEDGILIGYKTASFYGLSVGDRVTLLIPEPSSKRKVLLKKKKARIGGIFKVGLDEYDNNFAYASLPFLKQLFGEDRGVDQLALSLHKETNDLGSVSTWQRVLYSFWPFAPRHEQRVINTLRNNLPGITVLSWQDMYPALVSSLKLEKYVMFFILALIVLVASMSMISVLFMQIQQKRRDIAILKALGMPYRKIRGIFLRMGMFITFIASLAGLGLAAIAGFVLERYPFIELPDVYYVAHLPARMDVALFIIVFVCTMIIGFIATLIPARQAKHINVTNVLRQE